MIRTITTTMFGALRKGPYYNQWAGETHHPNVEYSHLKKKDQQDYWRWRHDHH